MLTDREATSSGTRIVFNTRPANVALALSIVVLLLTSIGALANYVIYFVAAHPETPLAKVMRRFDLGHEPSIPALYSSLALMVCAILLGVIATAKRRQHNRYAFHWFMLAILFVGLAIDESVMFHEMVDSAMSQRLSQFSRHLTRRGPFHFAWVIPGAIFSLTVGAACTGFLLNLERRTRWLFLASGILFVFGAIGMEMVAGVIAETVGLASIQHLLSQAVEEGCEMLGIVLFIYALLDHLERNYHGIQLNMGLLRTTNQGQPLPRALDKSA